MKTVAIQYYVEFGRGDASDCLDSSVQLTDEEAAVYDAAVADGVPLMEVPELQAALQRAYAEIEEQEIQNGIEQEDETVLECQGLLEMDPEVLNGLVADRDPETLAFFGLENASEEELEEWDAEDLEELPTVAAFDPEFEPTSPYDTDWTLEVMFVDPNEEEE